jgi:acetyl-CoA acyltransferase
VLLSALVVKEQFPMPEAVLVSAVRTPVGRAPKGALSTTRPDDLAALAISAALDRIPALDRAEVDDVILGCAQPEGEQGWDIARWAALRAGLPVDVPGVTVNRLCSSGLEAIALADLRIRSGGDRVVMAGGAESMSLLPFGGLKPSPNPYMAEHYPASLLTMGLTAERVARHYSVSREDQDAFALTSHQKGPGRAGRRTLRRRADPGHGHHRGSRRKGRQAPWSRNNLSADEGPRADTSAEALAKLKPAFHAQGTVTAGNSSQTSDGAAAVVLMEPPAARNWASSPSAAWWPTPQPAACPEEMGIGPITAIPKASPRRTHARPRSASSNSTKPSPRRRWPSSAS